MVCIITFSVQCISYVLSCIISVKFKIMNIKNLLSLILCISLFNACTDNFEDLNKNENFPEESAPELLLSGVQRSVAYEIMTHNIDYSASYASHFTKYDYNDALRFQWGGFSNVWNTYYEALRNNEIMLNLAKDQKNDSYTAVGLIMKSLIIAQVTDLWGNVPYSEAVSGKTKKNYTPAYDTQQKIYTSENGIIDNLKKANELLKTSKDAISGDIYYNGNLEKWRKFANSLRLRYLIRISKIHDVKSEIANIVTNEIIFKSNSDIAMMKSMTSKPNQFPISMWREGDYALYKMSDTMEEMYGKLNNDPRVALWFDAAYFESNKAVYKGMPVGITDNTEENLGIDVSKVSNLKKNKYFSTPDGENYVIMNYAEVKFLLAEAALKNYITGGISKVQEYYQQGIDASFSYYGISTPATYMADTDVSITDENDALEKVITQKWMANFMVGNEAWFDYLRTQLPVVKPNLDNVNTGKEIPSRYLYPNDEQVYNSKNYQSETSKMTGGKDNINTPHWWE